jgi:hypothetical protein
MFWVGQQVVCVDDSDHFPHIQVVHNVIEVKKGQIYTIRWIGMYRPYWVMTDGHSKSPGPFLSARLVEITRPGPDVPFLAIRFRPLVKTDISIFQAMLTPVEETV